MKATGILLVSPDTGFLAVKSAVVPHVRIPIGMIVNCLEFKAPCMIPLNTLEEPNVTIRAGSLKYPMNNPLKAPSKAPIAKAITIGRIIPP
ncbi:hypothetical protein DSECCO2_402030 [anaerobic digester metagenome]